MYQTSFIFRKVINSLSWTVISSIYRLFINFAIIVIISRILDPRDFGIINYTVIIFNSIFLITSDSVGQSYLVDKDQKNTISKFNSNLIFLIVIGSIFYISIGFINYIYFPDLWFSSLHLILFFSFLFRLPSIIFEYHLIKKKSFKLLSIIDMISLSLYFVSAILFAFIGMKYFSIILATTALYVSKSVMILSYFYKRLKELYPLLKINNYSLKLSFKFIKTNFATFVFDNTEKIILPILTSLPFLGYYTRANAINNIPMTVINKPIDNVIYSYLSDKKNLKTKIGSYFENLILFSNLLILPMSIFVMFYSDELVNLILGKNWDKTSIILKFLSPMIFFLFMTKCFEPIYKSSNFLNSRTKILTVFIILKICLLGFFINEENIISFVIVICLINFLYLLTLLLYCLNKIKFSIKIFFNYFRHNLFFLLIFILINILIMNLNFIYVLIINSMYYLVSILKLKFLLSKKTADIISDYLRI